MYSCSILGTFAKSRSLGFLQNASQVTSKKRGDVPAVNVAIRVVLSLLRRRTTGALVEKEIVHLILDRTRKLVNDYNNTCGGGTGLCRGAVQLCHVLFNLPVGGTRLVLLATRVVGNVVPGLSCWPCGA